MSATHIGDDLLYQKLPALFKYLDLIIKISTSHMNPWLLFCLVSLRIHIEPGELCTRVLPAIQEKRSIQRQDRWGGTVVAGASIARAAWKVRLNSEDFIFENSLQSWITSFYFRDSHHRMSQPQNTAVRSILFPLPRLRITSFWS